MSTDDPATPPHREGRTRTLRWAGLVLNIGLAVGIAYKATTAAQGWSAIHITALAAAVSLAIRFGVKVAAGDSEFVAVSDGVAMDERRALIRLRATAALGKFAYGLVLAALIAALALRDESAFLLGTALAFIAITSFHSLALLFYTRRI